MSYASDAAAATTTNYAYTQQLLFAYMTTECLQKRPTHVITRAYIDF